MKLPRSPSSWLGIVLLGALPLLACGPFWPEDALNQPKRILQPPLFHFVGELYKLPVPLETAHTPGTPAFTLDLEMAEVGELIKERMPNPAAHEAWLARYRALRAAMIAQADVSEHAMSERDATVKSWKDISGELQEICNPLPEDMQMYLKGAAVYVEYLGSKDETRLKEARQRWRDVLGRPKEERHWRSTWAAWMLFRTTDAEQKDERGEWLARVRFFAEEEKAADCLHLSIEATYILGREHSDLPGREAVTDAQWKRAALLRAALGHSRAARQVDDDRWVRAKWSAEFAEAVMDDPYLRSAQMLHLIEVAEAQAGWNAGHHAAAPQTVNLDLENWLAAFEKANLTDQKEAVTLAWIFYNAARFKDAARWLKLAPARDVIALSLRGKLAAQAGQRQETAKWFAAMAKELPVPGDTARANYESDRRYQFKPLTASNYENIRRHHLLADRGTAQLAVNDFSGALVTFLHTDFWNDTAYIAERLISPEELLVLARNGRLPGVTLPDDAAKFVGPPTPGVSIEALSQRYASSWGPGEDGSSMVRLLARRLMRARYFKDAARIVPEDLARAMNRYAAEYRKGHDSRLSEEDRGRAQWNAAQIHRYLGLELFGFEDGPDFACVGGKFARWAIGETRMRESWTREFPWDPPSAETLLAERPLFPATADERWRARHYGPGQERRFHYRYEAAELAWKAAKLMPDDTEETARVLCIAGSWLKNRDPKAADRFYKAMVRRNANVPLAQEAQEKRWFPNVDSTFDLTQ